MSRRRKPLGALLRRNEVHSLRLGEAGPYSDDGDVLPNGDTLNRRQRRAMQRGRLRTFARPPQKK